MGKHIIISRTDSIGDVVLTLPMAGILKQHFPDCKITFLGSEYTRPVVACSKYVDHFASWTDFMNLPGKEQVEAVKMLKADVIIHVFPKKQIARVAKKAGIRQRIGTTNRLYHWINCNKFVRLSRKNSDLHEFQLNMKLLKPLGIEKLYTFEETPAFYGMCPPESSHPEIEKLLDPCKFNLILHPKSKGSAREWGLENFSELIRLLPQEKFTVFLSGTETEGAQYRTQLVDNYPFVHDISGKLSLPDFISFIGKADGLVACSTGPLHIAAALGKYALGIYPPIRPMHPGRWAPVGIHTKVFVKNTACDDCRKGGFCKCIAGISPAEVVGYLAEIIR